MLQKLAAGATLALALGGCAALQPEEKLPPLLPAQALQAQPPQAQGVELTKQQGGRFIAFVGPKQQHTEPFLGVSDTNYFCLRSWLDNKTGEVAHQLYVEDSYYGGPFRWTGVHDQADTALRFVAISRNEITCEEGCSYADEFAAALPEAYLRAHQGGFSLSFTANEGKTLPIAVTADMIALELAAVDQVRTTVAKAAADPLAPPTPAPAPIPPATTPPAGLAPGTVVPAPTAAATAPPGAGGR
jgi:hypothetical protein